MTAIHLIIAPSGAVIRAYRDAARADADLRLLAAAGVPDCKLLETPLFDEPEAAPEPPTPAKRRAAPGSVRTAILDALALSPRTLDDLTRVTGCERKSVANALVKLRSDGRVAHSAATGMYQAAAQTQEAAE